MWTQGTFHNLVVWLYIHNIIIIGFILITDVICRMLDSFRGHDMSVWSGDEDGAFKSAVYLMCFITKGLSSPQHRQPTGGGVR